jgi:hypothetical protein
MASHKQHTDSTLEKQIDSFVGFLTCGIDFWRRAGQKLVALKQQNDGVFTDIIQQVEWITIEMLETIHEIGLGKLDPTTLLLPQRIATKVAGLPIEQQRTVVEAYRAGGSGGGNLDDTFSLGSMGRKPRNPATVVGLFEITVMDGKAFAKETKTNVKPATVVLRQGKAIVRFVLKA